MRRTLANCTTQHPVRRLLGNCVLAAALCLFVASCGDGPTTLQKDSPAIPGPQLAAGTPANGSGQCMGDDAVDFGLVDGISSTSDPTELVCEAEDIAIAEAIVTAVNGQAFDPNVTFECNEGEDLTLAMSVILDQTATSERQDIGLWIATDGGEAETGTCNHYNLVAGSTGTTNLDGDQCAGMAEGASTSLALGNVTVKCDDANNDGFLDIGACVSWKVPADDQVCPNNADGTLPGDQPTDFRAGTLPSNKAKCNCEPFPVPIVILQTATIEVKKVCQPTTDTGTFDLEIDNVGDDDYFKENDAACGGTTGAQTVGAGTQSDPGADHSVSESDFTAANYTSTLACTKNGSAFIPSEAYTAGTDRTVHVEPEDVVVCTFTNVRKGSIKIVKNAVPDDPQDFAYAATGAGMTPANFSLDDDADPTLSNERLFSGLAPNGARTVTETEPAGWTVTNIACTGATNSTVVIGAAGGFNAGDKAVSITLAAGENIVCTFTNTEQGSIKIVKNAVPDGPQNFAYAATGTGMTPANFSLDDDADPTLSNEQLFSGLLPNGARTVTETVPAGWDVTNIVCTGATNSTVVIGAAGGFNAGDHAVSITLAAGENIVCTFTNTQRATVTVNKRENGALPLTRAWEFEIRTGTSTTTAGTLRATGTANLTTGVVTFSCVNNSVCTNVGGVANFVPGSYQLCEVNMPVGWSNNITGFTPLGATPEGGNNGTECINITLSAGGSGVPTGVPNPIDNFPPPGGDARTIGYWKNWSSCTGGNQYTKAVARGEFDKTLDGNLPQLIGDFNVTTCAQGVKVLSKRDQAGNKKANDAAYSLAAQLLAAKLNISAGAGTCAAANTAIANGQTLLAAINFTGSGSYFPPGAGSIAGYTRQNALTLAATLDSYNNNTLCP